VKNTNTGGKSFDNWMHDSGFDDLMSLGFGMTGGGGGGGGMSLSAFARTAWRSPNGGTWSSGHASFFGSSDEGFAAGINYNFAHNSWSSVQGGLEGSMERYYHLTNKPDFSSDPASVTARVSGDPPYKLPNPWQAYVNKWRQILGKMPNAGVVIIGRGSEEFALKTLKDGNIGVWKVGDPNSIMSILDFRTAGTVWDTGMGALGLYNEDPRNDWTGSFFDRLYQWNPAPGKPGLYFNVGDERFYEYYYKYEYNKALGKHTMVPTTIKFP
jgi:hypothetical protein